MFRVFLHELISKSSSKSEAEMVGNVGRFDDSVEVFELEKSSTLNGSGIRTCYLEKL